MDQNNKAAGMLLLTEGQCIAESSKSGIKFISLPPITQYQFSFAL